MSSSEDFIRSRMRNLTLGEWVDECHTRSFNAGWWKEIQQVRAVSFGKIPESLGNKLEKAVFATKIALIHSETSEMLEGLRKGKPDEHLPHRTSEEVEAADLFIRLADYCGARGLDLAGATIDKLEYNAKRADHKPENRAAEGGKAF